MIICFFKLELCQAKEVCILFSSPDYIYFEIEALFQIIEVRRGQKTREFEAHRLNQGPYSKHADMSMSIVFPLRKVYNLGKSKGYCLLSNNHPVFNSVDECDIWWNGLSRLIEEAKHSDLVVLYVTGLLMFISNLTYV